MHAVDCKEWDESRGGGGMDGRRYSESLNEEEEEIQKWRRST